MKVIELLNKIANKEEVPEKIKFYSKYYIWYDNRYTGNKGYCLEPLQSDGNSFLEINTLYDLNKEIEVIEENKKIEKLKLYYFSSDNLEMLIEMLNDLNKEHINKINEIIDFINKE